PTPPPTTSTLFPYTTLFRSHHESTGAGKYREDFITQTMDCEPSVARRASDYNRSLRRTWMSHGIRGRCEPGTARGPAVNPSAVLDRKSTRLNSSHRTISYAV